MSIFSRIFNPNSRYDIYLTQIEELKVQLEESNLDNTDLRRVFEAHESLMSAVREDSLEIRGKFDKLLKDYELKRKDLNIICRLSKEVYKAIILFLYELDGGDSGSRLGDRRQDLTNALKAQGWSSEEVIQILNDYMKKHNIHPEIPF